MILLHVLTLIIVKNKPTISEASSFEPWSLAVKGNQFLVLQMGDGESFWVFGIGGTMLMDVKDVMLHTRNRGIAWEGARGRVPKPGQEGHLLSASQTDLNMTPSRFPTNA